MEAPASRRTGVALKEYNVASRVSSWDAENHSEICSDHSRAWEVCNSRS